MYLFMVNHNENEDKMKNRSHRYDMNRTRSARGCQHSKYKIASI